MTIDTICTRQRIGWDDKGNLVFVFFLVEVLRGKMWQGHKEEVSKQGPKVISAAFKMSRDKIRAYSCEEQRGPDVKRT